MTPTSRILTPFFLLALICCPAICFGSDATENEPIYLEEPKEPPPASVVRHQTVDIKYEDESLRVQIDVAVLSNDTAVNDGKYLEFYRDGQKFSEGTFKDGQHSGEWTYWHPNGQICKSINFVDGLPDGKWEVFRSDGTRTSLREYAKGKRSGQWITYFDNGEKPRIEVSYADGLAHGNRVVYFPNGQKRQVIIFEAGKMHGTMTEWDDTGKKTAEVLFEDGERKGDVKRFE